MTDPVWSVILLLSIGLAGTAYIIYYIIQMANQEMQDGHDTTHRSDSESS